MAGLYEQLISYTNEDYYPMHMPGHKRNMELMRMGNPIGIDITEIEGFDNLHQPEDILRSLSERLAELYGAKKSYPLVNGSTAGILAGISAATSPGDMVLIARNSHKSVYHGAMVRNLRPVYCYPQKLGQIPVNGGILPENIEGLLIKHPETRLVVITSPTYEGIASDVRAIAEIVHRQNALLLVDEAHGAHFGFHSAFPESAVMQGADIIIQSLHKTLPAMTQSAVLHCNREELNGRLQKYLAVYQSSSPSYVLMAGIDQCIKLLEEQGKELFEKYTVLLQEFYASLQDLRFLKIVDFRMEDQELAGHKIVDYKMEDQELAGHKIINHKPANNIPGEKHGIYDVDRSKITVSVRGTGLTGHELQVLLREKYHIELEMAASEYALAMTSIADTEEGLTRFAKALGSIDRMLGDRGRISSVKERTDCREYGDFPKAGAELILLPGEAMESQSETVKLPESAGRISAAFISQFPPGVPLLVPGERIDAELVRYIEKVKNEGITITGLTGIGMDELEVVIGKGTSFHG
ncbi:MAG TPA: aminotransferase class I/II-fold pyridoxal phosphate-dependent enzyme [Clostridiales bacterium]|nr:aminotransferase class I/II-fold pyridoxal phosphate-dependent enzyme [Clostridiales bacterium]